MNELPELVRKAHDTSKIYSTLLAARGNVAAGWVRGRSRVIDNDGKVKQRCALTAICDAAGGNASLIRECVKRVVKAIGRYPLIGPTPPPFILVSWNDEVMRTQEQVLDGFDLALAEREE